VSDDAHDVGLTMIIDGIAHGLAVYGEAFIVGAVRFVPAVQRVIEMDRISTDQTIADDRLAGNDTSAVFYPTAEARSRLLAQRIGPVGDCLVATHATEGGRGCDGEYRGELMTPPLLAAGIGYVGKESG
jgi:hypothetical protein